LTELVRPSVDDEQRPEVIFMMITSIMFFAVGLVVGPVVVVGAGARIGKVTGSSVVILVGISTFGEQGGDGSRGGSAGDTTGSGGTSAGGSSNGSPGGSTGVTTGAGGTSAGEEGTRVDVGANSEVGAGVGRVDTIEVISTGGVGARGLVGKSVSLELLSRATRSGGETSAGGSRK
jgi:hypothetical protein